MRNKKVAEGVYEIGDVKVIIFDEEDEEGEYRLMEIEDEGESVLISEEELREIKKRCKEKGWKV